MTRASSFGVFVEVAPGVEGLCHNSEIRPQVERRREREKSGEETLLPIGEEFEFKVIRISEAEKKIGLSYRAVAADEERSRLEDYQRRAAAATMTIEEAIHLKNQG